MKETSSNKKDTFDLLDQMFPVFWVAPEFNKSWIRCFFYLNKSICRKYIISYLKLQIICDNENFTQKDLEKFPIFYFEHKELNYTFELTFKDLFYNDTLIHKVIFLIVFDVKYYRFYFSCWSSGTWSGQTHYK